MSRENEKLQQLLIQKAESTAAGAAMLLEKTQDWQIIQEFISNRHAELILNPRQQEKLELYQYINNQLLSGKYTAAQLVTHLTKLYKRSFAQAYEDIRISKELFAALFTINKQWENNSELEICRMTRQKCIDIGDFKNGAVWQKRINELIAMQPDEEDTPGEYFKGHQLVAVFDPRLLGGSASQVNMKELLSVLNEKRQQKINIDMFEHINYEDIPTNGNDATSL